MKNPNCKYTSVWSEMKVGDKVFFKKGDGVLMIRLRSAITGSLKLFKRGTTMEFVTQSEDEPRGVTVFRIK